MQITPITVWCETVTHEDFRLEYTLLRTDPDNAALCPVYGIACTAHLGEMSTGAYHHPAVTENLHAARRLFRLLTENAVFPDHIDDVMHDLRENWSAPAWTAV